MTNRLSYLLGVSYTQQLLAEELFRRKSKRPGYSLRAFAATLGMSPGRLSELLSGKRPITLKNIEILAKKLSLPETVQSTWAEAAVLERKKLKEGFEYRQINPQELELISEWRHFAILSLVNTADFKADPKWIARRLRISTTDVIDALDRLETVGLLSRHAEKWQVLQSGVTTTHDVVSQALRHSHKQHIRQAIESIDSVDLELRDVTSICMDIDPKKIAQAKKKIAKFRRELCELLSTGQTTEVYRLNVQLYPLTFRD